MEEEDKIGEEDSQFMKLAKKLTAKALQKKGECCNRSCVCVCVSCVYTKQDRTFFFLFFPVCRDRFSAPERKDSL